MIPLWTSNYSKREEWIDNGLNAYEQSITDITLRELVRQSIGGTVVVSLYGETQVGKTTFILDLLKIKSKYADHLGELLRCGRGHGNSATPTALIYRRSINDFFAYKESDSKRKELNQDQLKDKLMTLRERVESRDFTSLDGVTIEIPRKYFSELKPNIEILIVDLPGCGSKNELEKEHVSEILKKYLSISTIILIITRANSVSQVSDLFENEHINEYYGWKYLSSRYRLILTYSYTGESGGDDYLASKKDLDADYVIQYYRDEMRTNGKKEVPENVGIYPFEIGRSWEIFKAKFDKSDYFASVSRIQCELKERLINDLIESSGKISQIKNMKMIPEAFKKIKEKELYKLSFQITDSKIYIKKTKRQIKKYKELVCGNDKKLKEMTEKELIKDNKFIRLYEGELDRDKMISYIGEIIHEVKNQLRELNGKADKLGYSVKNVFDAEACFKEIKKKLKKILFKKHVIFFGGPKLSDKKSLDSSITNLNREWKEYIDENNIAYWNSRKRDAMKLKAYSNKLANKIKQNQVELRNTKKKIIDLEKQIKQNEKKFRKEIERANVYREYFSRAFLGKLNEIISGVNEKTPLEVLLDIIFCIKLTNDYDALIEVNK